MIGIHYRTIENHRTAISQKLGLQGSHALVKFAFDHKSEL
jgi:DNA-binding CsgD family transcriptional regulator